MALKYESEWMQNKEFGTLAISKLISWLGKGKNADVEKTNPLSLLWCLHCPFVSLSYFGFGFLWCNPDRIIKRNENIFTEISFMPLMIYLR